jgi:4-amino-4-deoxy-L-arabinose transferase-like glycosyltransferase
MNAGFYAAAGFVFIYLFFTCLTPPVYYDTLVYHLAVPEQYIQAGRIINMKENIFSFFPQLMQMNCLFFLLISGELSVKLLYFFMAIMSAAALAGMAAELKADKKISVLLLAACPLFLVNASRAGAELPLMFFTTLLVYILIKGCETGFKTADGLLAGIIAGSIISIKYTGVTVYFFGAAVFLFMLIRKKAGIKGLMSYLLVPGLIVLPYLIRNYLYTGDPFYPFLTGISGVSAGLKADAAVYLSHVSGFGLPHSFFNLLISPFAVVYNEKLFGGDVLSPLFLIAFVLLPLTDIKKTGMPALFMVFYFIAWFFTGEVLRFLLPVVPVAAVIAGCAYANTSSKLKYPAFVLLIAVQAVSSLYFGEKYLKPFELFVLDRGEYIGRNITYYKAAEFINENTEPGARILVLGDARSSYIKRPVLAYTVFNARSIFEGFKEAGDDKILYGFKLRNIRYMFVNWTELYRLKDAGYGDVAALAGDAKFKNIMDKYFKKIYSDDNCDVYAFMGRR